MEQPTNGISPAVALPANTQAYYTGTFATPPTVSPSTDYYVGFVGDTSDLKFYYKTLSGPIQRYQSDNSYATPATLVSSGDSADTTDMIYCTYTPAEASRLASISASISPSPSTPSASISKSISQSISQYFPSHSISSSISKSISASVGPSHSISASISASKSPSTQFPPAKAWEALQFLFRFPPRQAPKRQHLPEYQSKSVNSQPESFCKSFDSKRIDKRFDLPKLKHAERLHFSLRLPQFRSRA